MYAAEGPTPSPAPTIPLLPDGSIDYDQLTKDSQAQVSGATGPTEMTGSGTGKPAARPVVVPLWRVRPTTSPPAPTIRSSGAGSANAVEHGLGGGSTSSANAAEHSLLMAGGGDPLAGMVDINQATTAYLDMSAKDRADLRAMFIANGQAKPEDDDATIMNLWTQWVNVAVDYNTNRKLKDWISPWEAIKLLGPSQAAKDGKRFNGYTGYVGPIDETHKEIPLFTWSQLEMNATQILEQTLGRAPSKAEEKAYLDAVNAASRANPVITHRTGATDGSGNTNDTKTTSGGIDANSIIYDKARQDPTYGPVQAATTYFDAAMQALNAVVRL